MSPLESILYVIWRGVAIGILISAPMGPVGILCIQRTLDKGRKAGFYTGIGAAISDLIYCLLTGFCLSFIEDFLNENQNVIQLVGSLVLIAFSVYLFKKNPSSGMRRPLPQNVSARKNILGGFLFTFSNPLIIFLIIGLFARFNFTIPEIKGYYYAIGYLFIIAGALGWWYGVTYGIDKVRSRFNMRSMKILNIIIGVVILCFAAVGIATSIVGLTSTDASARSTQPLPKTLIADTTINSSGPLAMLDSANACHYFRLDFKLRNVAASSSMKRYAWTDSAGVRHSSAMPPWSLTLEDRDARSYRMEFSIEEIETSQIDSQAAPVVRIYDPDGSLIFSRPILRGIAAASEWNHFRIIHTHGQPLTLLGGHTSLRCIFPLSPTRISAPPRILPCPRTFRRRRYILPYSPGAPQRARRQADPYARARRSVLQPQPNRDRRTAADEQRPNRGTLGRFRFLHE